MFEIRDVLVRVGRGEFYSAISRATGHARKTVAGYVRTAVHLGWVKGTEVSEELAAAVARRHRPVRVLGSGDSQVLLLEHKELITGWLRPAEGERRGLKLSKVHVKLGRMGVVVPYSSLHRFARDYCGFRGDAHVTVRMADSEPGQYAQVDFGKLGYLGEANAGRKLLWALIVTLPFSRHQFVKPMHSQRIPDLIEALEDAWEFFSGVPSLVILDNLKAAITKADVYDPVANRTFGEYANYRGFVIDATKPVHPKGKPQVERNVQYVRENFFRGERWLNLEHVQREAVTWSMETAGTRIHGTTRRKPLAVFETEELPALRPLTGERFDPPSWGQYKVHPDHHVSVHKALYSVPTKFIGKRAWVRSDSGLVRIYVDDELVKTHIRQAPGGRSTDHGDYPEERSVYTMRSVDWLKRQAFKRGAEIGSFTEILLAGPTPWAKIRQSQRLMRLGEKYGWERVNAACGRANEYGISNVRRVESIITNNPAAATGDQPAGRNDQQPLKFERPAGSFSHAHSKEP